MDAPFRALIIDDDAEMARVFRRALTMWGWQADECHSLSEALTLLRNGRYDLALCDVNLPDGNGLSLAHALSKAMPSLRVIMVSGNPANINRARIAGFSLSLRKPFDLDDLKALVAPENRTRPGA